MPIGCHKLSQDDSECKLNNVFCQQWHFIHFEGICVETTLFLVNRSDLLKRWYNVSYQPSCAIKRIPWISRTFIVA